MNNKKISFLKRMGGVNLSDIGLLTTGVPDSYYDYWGGKVGVGYIRIPFNANLLFSDSVGTINNSFLTRLKDDVDKVLSYGCTPIITMNNFMYYQESNTRLSFINVINGGTGYTSAPTVTITGGTGSGASATARISGVTNIIIDNPGKGYDTPPVITISAPTSGIQATAVATVEKGIITYIKITNKGSGYTSNPTVFIGIPNSPTEPLKVQAVATAVASIGQVTEINIVNRGSNYGTTGFDTTIDGNTYRTWATVGFTGGNGSGATAIALSGFKFGETLAQNEGFNTVTLVKFWRYLAGYFSYNKRIEFDIMDEPTNSNCNPQLSNDEIVNVYNSVISALRNDGITNIIHVQTLDSSNITSPFNIQACAKSLENIIDPLNRYVINLHIYLNNNLRGFDDPNTLVNETETLSDGNALKHFSKVIELFRSYQESKPWLKLHIGEVGVYNNPNGLKALQNFYQLVYNNRDVCRSFTMWGGGNWETSYPLKVDPTVTNLTTSEEYSLDTYPLLTYDKVSLLNNSPITALPKNIRRKIISSHKASDYVSGSIVDENGGTITLSQSNTNKRPTLNGDTLTFSSGKQLVTNTQVAPEEVFVVGKYKNGADPNINNMHLLSVGNNQIVGKAKLLLSDNTIRDTISDVSADTFTNANNTNLVSHTSSSGSSWSLLNGTTATPAVIFNNRLVLKASSNVYKMDVRPHFADYEVSADITYVATQATLTFGLFIRGFATTGTATSNTSLYKLEYQTTSKFRILRTTDGVNSNIVESSTITLTPGTTYNLRLRAEGNVISAFLDNTLIIRFQETTSSNTIIEPGYAGVIGVSSQGDTTGIHIDNFTVRPFVLDTNYNIEGGFSPTGLTYINNNLANSKSFSPLPKNVVNIRSTRFKEICEKINANFCYSIARSLNANKNEKLFTARNAGGVSIDIGVVWDTKTRTYVLDETALLTHAGSGNVTISKVYNQRNDGKDLVQTDVNKMPSIVTSGVINKINGVPTIQFGAGKSFILSGIEINTTNLFVSGILHATSYVSGATLLSLTDPVSPTMQVVAQNNISQTMMTDGRLSALFQYNRLHKINVDMNLSSPLSIEVDGIRRAMTSINTVSAPYNAILINGTDNWAGGFSELIISTNALNQKDKEYIEANQDIFYNTASPTAKILEDDVVTTDISPQTFSIGENPLDSNQFFDGEISQVVLTKRLEPKERKLLVEYLVKKHTINTRFVDLIRNKNKVGLLSLRKLGDRYTGASIEVTDGTTFQDIGFTVDGHLDTVALMTYAGTSTVKVSKWYDQSGYNDHFVETDDTRRPVIVENGVLQTINNRPTLKFSGLQRLTSSKVAFDRYRRKSFSFVFSGNPQSGRRPLSVGSTTRNDPLFTPVLTQNNTTGQEPRTFLRGDTLATPFDTQHTQKSFSNTLNITTVTDNVHNIVMSYNGILMTATQLLDRANTALNYNLSANLTSIGGYTSTSFANGFTGNISEVILIDEELSPEEIHNINQNQSTYYNINVETRKDTVFGKVLREENYYISKELDGDICLDFVNGKYSHPYQNNLTITRSSVAYAQNKKGTWLPFQLNRFRLTDRGLLIEDTATNLLNQSWFNTGTTSAGLNIKLASSDFLGGVNGVRLIEALGKDRTRYLYRGWSRPDKTKMYSFTTFCRFKSEKQLYSLIQDNRSATSSYYSGGSLYNDQLSGEWKTIHIPQINHPTYNVTVVNGGSGYTSAPTVTVSGAGAGTTEATGFATIVDGAVTNVTVYDNGKTYTTPPTITLTGGGGSGAIATITNVSMINNYLLTGVGIMDKGAINPNNGLPAPYTVEKDLEFVDVCYPIMTEGRKSQSPIISANVNAVRQKDNIVIGGDMLSLMKDNSFIIVLQVKSLTQAQDLCSFLSINGIVAMRRNLDHSGGGSFVGSYTSAIPAEASDPNNSDYFKISRKIALCVNKETNMVSFYMEGTAPVSVSGTIPTITSAKLEPFNGYLEKIRLYKGAFNVGEFEEIAERF